MVRCRVELHHGTILGTELHHGTISGTFSLFLLPITRLWREESGGAYHSIEKSG